jgi:hypothetical protein
MEKAKKLEALVLESVPVKPEHEWMLLALEDACETAIEEHPEMELDELLFPTQLGYAIALTIIHSVIQAAFSATSSDTVQLNHRGRLLVVHRPR